MSDYNDNSRRRDRHRRQKPQGGRNTSPNQQRDTSATHRDDRPERRPEIRQEILPPLPKLPVLVCVKCGETIQDITSALTDKGGSGPVHFDCVISFLTGAENLGANEKIVYIGQGRFAVMFFENPADTRKFKIVRIIEWESREAKADWRLDISERFSHVK